MYVHVAFRVGEPCDMSCQHGVAFADGAPLTMLNRRSPRVKPSKQVSMTRDPSWVSGSICVQLWGTHQKITPMDAKAL